MNINRKLHEEFGYPWHERDRYRVLEPGVTGFCRCGSRFRYPYELDRHCAEHNPDYKADPRLVIREMEKRKELIPFVKAFYLYVNFDPVHLWETGEQINLMPIDILHLIMDTTGKLRDLAIEWLREQKKGEGDD